MTLELITGRAGKAHISSEDDRAYHAYVNGDDRYVLHGGTAEIINANKVHVDPVELLVDGAHVRITGTGEDVVIENGTSSYKRIDVIVLHYTRSDDVNNYVESIELKVISGTPVESNASPAVPEMPTSGTILDGSTDVYIPMFQLLIDGLTPKDLTLVLPQYSLPAELGGIGAKLLWSGTANIGTVFNNLQIGKFPMLAIAFKESTDHAFARVSAKQINGIGGTSTKSPANKNKPEIHVTGVRFQVLGMTADTMSLKLEYCNRLTCSPVTGININAEDVSVSSIWGF